jgi:hypothetical protein
MYGCNKDSEIIESIKQEPPKEEIPAEEPPKEDRPYALPQSEYYNINQVYLYNPNSYNTVEKKAEYALPFNNWYDEKKNSSVVLNIEDIPYEFKTDGVEHNNNSLTASYKGELDTIKVHKVISKSLFQKEEDFKLYYHINQPTNTLLNYDTLVILNKAGHSFGDDSSVLLFSFILKHKNPVFLISFENVNREGVSISINGIKESDKSFYRHTDEGTLYYEYISFNQKTDKFKLELFRTYREDEGVTLLEKLPTATGNATTQTSLNGETFTVKVLIADYNYNRIIVTRENVQLDGVNQELENWGDGEDGEFIFDL